MKHLKVREKIEVAFTRMHWHGVHTNLFSSSESEFNADERGHADNCWPYKEFSEKQTAYE